MRHIFGITIVRGVADGRVRVSKTVELQIKTQREGEIRRCKWSHHHAKARNF